MNNEAEKLVLIGAFVQIVYFVAVITFFIAGLVAAFHTGVLTGLIFLFIPVLSVLNGIFMMFGYSLSDNIAHLLNIH